MMDLIRRMGVLAGAGAMAIASCAVAQGEGMATATEPAEATTTVALIDAGSGKKSEMRYALSSGQSQRVHLTISQRVQQTMNGMAMGQPTPGQKFTVSATVEGVEDGVARIGVEIEGVEVIETEGVNPQTVQMSQQQAEQFAGLRGSVSVDATGRVTDASVANAAEKGLPPTLSELMKSFGQAMFVAFPAEPVGEGATWRVTTASLSLGQEAMSIAEVALTSRDGASFTVEMDVAQEMDFEGMMRSQMPPGTDPEVEFESSGSGSVTGALDELGARNASTTVGMEATVSAEMSGQPFTMELDGEVVTTLSRAE